LRLFETIFQASVPDARPRKAIREMQNQLSAAVEHLALDWDLTFKPMLGGVCAYTEGRVFTSLPDVGLPLKQPPSKQYIVVPASMQGDAAALSIWVKQDVEAQGQ
jgi:hypothetical protein